MADIEKRALAQNAATATGSATKGAWGSPPGAALYMHCLPADIGAEVSARVMKRFRWVARQANKKVYVIMALLAAAKVEDLRRRLASDES